MMRLDLATIIQWLNGGQKGAQPASAPAAPTAVLPDPPPMKKGTLADLFAGPGNTYWDLGRLLGTVVILSAVFVVVWGVVRLSKDPDLLGLAAVVTAVAVWIGLKDFANRKPDVTVTGNIETAEVAGDINVVGEDK